VSTVTIALPMQFKTNTKKRGNTGRIDTYISERGEL
jgi:hypothetical protein